jgi:4a-hydroxytetrahydrobiopterin dehydratase
MKTSIRDIFRDHGHLLDDADNLSFLHRPLKGLLSEAGGLPRSLPISAPRPTWEQLEGPNRLSRTFEFGSVESLTLFVVHVLELQEEMNHHGDIRITKFGVSIEVYTHDLDEVTNRDIKYAKLVDLIYKDAQQVRGRND